uniref:Rap-GAP domain-containing protein n=1 Tax=Echinostoma caproni TaxID=27848 RepID=A0A183AYC6_9TREM
LQAEGIRRLEVLDYRVLSSLANVGWTERVSILEISRCVPFLLILEARARATDVLPSTMPHDMALTAQSVPNPYYEVLFAFHIRRANYRAAAMTMFEYAYRLAEETNCSMPGQLSAGGFRAGGARLLYGLQRQAVGLLAAINALYIVPVEHQWLVRPGSGNLDIRNQDITVSSGGDFEAVRVSEAFRLDFRPIVVAVTSRCADLAQYIQGHAYSVLGHPPTLSGLSGLPSALDYESDLVVQTLNSLTSSKAHVPVTEDRIAPITSTNAGSVPHALSRLYWSLLELILTRMDPPSASDNATSKRGSHQPGLLHLIACERLLESTPIRLHIPTWLITRLQSTHFQTSRPVQLLRLYWRFDRVEDAYNLTMDMLTAATGRDLADPAAFGLQASLPKTVVYDKQQSQRTVWIPHNLIVNLLEALSILSADYPACKIHPTRTHIAEKNKIHDRDFGLFCYPASILSDKRVLMARADDPRLGQLFISFDTWKQQKTSNSRPAIALIRVPSDEGVRRNGGRPGACEGPAVLMDLLPRLGTVKNCEWNIDLKASGEFWPCFLPSE